MDPGDCSCGLLVEDISDTERVAEKLQDALAAAEAAREEGRARWQDAERRRLIAESLKEVVAALNSNAGLPAILDLIAAQARELLDSQAVGIYRLEGEAGRWAVEAARGLLFTYVAGSNLPIGHTALRQAILSRGPVIGYPEITGESPETGAQRAGNGSWKDEPPQPRRGRQLVWYDLCLAVPIMAKDEVYGGMLLYYTGAPSLSPDEIQLAVSFCDQAGLAIDNAQLRERVGRVSVIAERERLARDLHDAITQTLFSASVIAEAMPRVWRTHPEEALQGIDELRRLTKGALAEMRTMLVELRPAALTEKPLGELLTHLCDAFSSRTRLPVTLEIEGDAKLPPAVQVALYRIAQEALNNVEKHARASMIAVTLSNRRRRVRMQVTDDGCGFDGAASAGGLGLGSMRERARGIEAVMSIVSHVGAGTRVSVSWHDTSRS